MTDWRVPFNRPTATGHEMAAIAAAFASGHFSGDGHFTHACNRVLESATGVRKAMLTTSCTHALEMAALLLNIQPGDEVVVPSFTFVSTVNAFALRGATPVFVDIRPDTLNIDESRIVDALTSKTKAIVVVHYAGVGCEMDAIAELARSRGIAVVEDNAHGLFGSFRGRPLGSFGALAALSFHETKNVTCGEGGALLIQDEALIASSARSSAKRVQTAVDSFAERSTSTAGLVLVPVTSPRSCSPQCCTRNSSDAMRFRGNAGEYGIDIGTGWPDGQPRATSASRTCRTTSSTRRTCFIY